MADKKKVLDELRDVQDAMKRVATRNARRTTTTRFQAVKVPSKLEDEGSRLDDESPRQEEVLDKPKPPPSS